MALKKKDNELQYYKQLIVNEHDIRGKGVYRLFLTSSPHVSYVGSTFSVNTGQGIYYRFCFHRRELMKGTHKTKSLQEAVEKANLNELRCEVLQNANTEDEARSLEAYYMEKFDTLKNGYNTSTQVCLRKKIKQYSLEGVFIKEWDSIIDAARHYRVYAPNVRRSVEQESRKCAGFFWANVDVTEGYMKERAVRYKDKYYYKYKKVKQMDLEGNTIECFNSVKEASEKTGVTYSGIAQAARGVAKTAAGYKWEYIDEPKFK